jgi:hypothetical protein
MLDLIQEWAQQCYNKHFGTCPGRNIPVMPKRVLEISDNLRLIESTKPMKGHYAALSYSWGGTNPVMLTQSSRSSLLGGIDEESLPRTIRDAVLVTRNLKLQYLWIDALCIIQDDPDDKIIEISKMPEFYKNAYVTISAATARSSVAGFLQPRGLPPGSQKFSMQYPLQPWDDDSDDDDDDSKASSPTQEDDSPLFIMDTMHYPTIDDDYINSRAWVRTF